MGSATLPGGLWPGEVVCEGAGGPGIHFPVGGKAEALVTDRTCGDPLPWADTVVLGQAGAIRAEAGMPGVSRG